jgi:CDP-diacylglycerol---glycerol-3-phosphate 3-phosphatidyltransferase
MPSTLPNTLTVARLVLSPVFFLLIIADDPIQRQISIVVFLVAALTDWYDGEIARRYGSVTNLGKFLDPLADKFLTSAAFAGFAVLGYVHWWMVVVIIVRDILITVLRSLAEIRDEHIVTSKTAQWKTFIQMAVLYYLLLLVVGRDVGWVRDVLGGLIPALLGTDVLYGMMMAVTVLTLWTGVQYLIDNRRFLLRLISGARQLI